MTIKRGRNGRTAGSDEPQAAQTVIIPHGIAPTFNPGPPIPMMYFEGGTPMSVASFATLSDADSLDFDTGSLTVSITSASAFDQLSIRNQGTGGGQIGLSGSQVSYGGTVIGTVAGGANGTNLVVTFSGAGATPEAAQALVKNVTYATTDEALPTGPKSFTLVVNDGDGDSAQIQTNIQVFGVNDAPVLADFETGTIQYAAGASPLRLDTDASVSDIDSPDFSGGSLTLSITAGKVNGEDVLGLATDATVTLAGNVVSVGGVAIGTLSGGGAGAGDLVIAFNSTAATLARVTELIHHLTYWDSSASPILGTRTLGLTVRDGDGTGMGPGGNDSASAALQVQVAPGGPPPTGQPPVLTVPNHFAMQYVEGATFAVKIAASAQLTDADSPDFGGGSLSVSKVDAGAGDQIGFTHDSGVVRSGSNLIFNNVVIGTVTGGANGTPLNIAFNSNATPAIAETLVRVLAYATTSDAPAGGLATFTIVVNDGDGNLAQVSSTVDVVPVNDAPTIANLYADFTTFTIGGGPVLIDVGTPAVTSDIDGTELGSSGLRVSITGGRVASEDRLGLAAGSGVTMSGFQLLIDGVPIGSVLIDGDVDGEDLWFSIHNGATHAQVTRIIQAITYWNSDSTPTDALKTITVTLDDGDGDNNGGVFSTIAVAQVQVGQPVVPAFATFGSTLTADMVLSADGTRLYESTGDGFVNAYNAGTGAILGHWDVGNKLGAIDLSPDGSFLMAVERQVISQADGNSTVTAYRIDTSTGAVTSFVTVNPGFFGAFWDVSILDGHRVLFPGTFNGTVGVPPRVLDLNTGVYTDSLFLGGGATTVSTSADRSQILLGSTASSDGPLGTLGLNADNTVSLLHHTDLFAVGTSGFNHGAQAVGTTAGYIAQDAGGLHIYDLSLNYLFDLNQNGSLFNTGAVGGLLLDPDGEFLFVLDTESNNIKQISLADLNVVRTIALGGIDVLPGWIVNGTSATYGNRLLVTEDLGRFAAESGQAIIRVDAAMPSLNLVGDGNANELNGSIGDDLLDGGGGADILRGGHGDDVYYVDNAGDAVVDEVAHKGHDRILTTVSYTLGANADIEELAAIAPGASDALNLTGSSSANEISGNAGVNILDGLGGNDILRGFGGNDFLVGGTGSDTMYGGAGDDTFYVDNAGDVVIEAAGEGNDRVAASASHALAAGSEIELLETINQSAADALNLTGSDSANTINGNEGANILNGAGGNDVLRGFGGNDLLDGGAGADAMTGGAGNDVYVVDNAGDAVAENGGEGSDEIRTSLASYSLGANFENLTGLSAAGQLLVGNGVGNVIAGGGGNDALIGGAGNDTMAGGAGNDTYYVDALGDVVIEAAGQGNDRVATSVSYALAAGAAVEQLEAVNSADTSAMDLTANDFVNLIIGNAGMNLIFAYGGNDTLIGNGGNDFLIGGTGADLMYGGTGNDTFYVDDIGDRAYELAGEGTDRIATLISYTLDDASEVELLESTNTLDTNAMDLTGSNSANQIIGNAGVNLLYGLGGNDQLVGLAGNDFLVGGTGADLMYGGTGNDTFYVDDIGDRAYELAGEGTADRIATSISYTLDGASEVELLEAVNLTATDAMDLTGSDSGQTIIGNDGVNLLFGAGGNDTLIARAGNDFLIGGTGDDVMHGGTGNDTYYVDSANDQANELAGQGNDRVATSVSYTLSAEIETLEAVNGADTSAINLTGNAIANTIAANNGANVLDGKGGNDLLIGYGGADMFAFTTALGADNVDHIFDFVSGTDKIALDDAIFGALGAGAFAFGAQAGDADDRIVYDSATGNLYFDADGNGSGAQVLFATLDTHPALAASDFTVI